MTKVGIQLIIFGKQQQEDLAGAFAAVKRAGYAGVEMGPPALPVAQVKELLAKNGLALTGFHGGYAMYEKASERAALIEKCKALGGKYLICSGVSDRDHLAGYEQTAPVFNQIGAECKKAGLTFCYHNHAWEFTPLEGGVRGLHRLGELTDPALVKYNVDVYWVHIGDVVTPDTFIKRHANRMGYYHIKDGRPGEFLPLGQGEVDLKGALKAAQECGIDWLIYEQDRPKVGAEEDATVSRKYLRALGY